LFNLEKQITVTENVLLRNGKGLESDLCTDKKENKIFLIYSISDGSGWKVIYEEGGFLICI
jgi:hypothetical protein